MDKYTFWQGLISNLSWPLTVFGIALLFRAKTPVIVAKFLEYLRTRNVNFEAFGAKGTITAAETAAAAQPADEVDARLQVNVLPPLERPAVALREAEVGVRIQIVEQANRQAVLMRHLALVMTEQHNEWVYNRIFGSQIELLDIANSAGGATSPDVAALFYSTSTKYPEFYKGFGYNDWLGFLYRNQLLELRGDRYFTSIIGQDFLGYLTFHRLFKGKFG